MALTSQPLHRPRYWISRAAIALARAGTYLPIPLQLWCGRRLGELTLMLLGGRRRVAKINLALCFPDYSRRARRRLLRESFRATGMGLMEAFLAWWCSDKRLKRLTTFEGQEHLEAIRCKGQGILLLSAHFTTLEISARLLSLHVPVTAMYRPNANPLLDRVIRRGREAHAQGEVIAKDDIRALLKALKAGQTVWYAPDQGVQRSQGVPVDFFGHPAVTTTATARLARVTGAPVVPFFAVRQRKPLRYRLVIKPPLADFPSGNETRDAARINQVFEQAIRCRPDQYFWLHRRFKRMPGGDPYRKKDPKKSDGQRGG